MKQKRTNTRWIAYLLLLVGGVLFTVSCSTSEDTSSVAFKLTDAPDTSGITNVKVTVSEINMNESADAADGQGGSWKVLSLNPAKEVDLLTLANGVTESLGELSLTGGTQINQIRLVVDQAKVSLDQGANYIPLTIPSKSIKIVNAFQVPLSGIINIVLDFDVSKSIVKTGNGTYILKPAIRSIVENEAGRITGTAPAGATVYAYKDGTYIEGTEPTTSSD